MFSLAATLEILVDILSLKSKMATRQWVEI